MFDPFSELTTRPVRSAAAIVQEGLQTLFQLMLLCLLVLGLGGLVYKAVGPGGWLESALTHIWKSDPVYALLGVLALVIAGGGVRRGVDRLPLFGKGGDWLVYGCLALGGFFALRLIATGSL
jgi:hypothetical protein